MKRWLAVMLWCWWLPRVALAQVIPVPQPQQEMWIAVPLLWSQGSHADIVSAIACSSDGRWIASATARGDQGMQPVVNLWTAPTGRYLRSFNTDWRTYLGDATALLFSPDSRYLAVAQEQPRLPIYDLSTFRKWTEYALSGYSLSTDRYGQWLAVGGASRVSLIGGFSIRTWRVAPSDNEFVYVWMTPDGRYLAAALGMRVQLWRADDQTLVWEQPIPARAQCIDGFAPADAVAVGREDGVVSLFRLSDGQPLIATLPQGYGFVHLVAFSPDGTLLASARGHTLRLWRTTDYALVNEITLREWAGYGGTPQATSLAWSRDSASVLVGFEDGEIRQYAVPGGQQLRWIARRVEPIGFDPTSYRLAVRYRDQTEIWDSASGRVLQVVPHTGILSPDWRWLAQVSSDRITIRRFPDGSVAHIIQQQEVSYLGARFSPDSRHLLLEAIFGAGRWLTVLYRTDLWQPEWQGEDEMPLLWSPRSTFFVTHFSPNVGNSQVVVRRRQDGAEMLRLPAASRLVFSPNERWLAVVHPRDRVDIYRTTDWSLQWQFPATNMVDNWWCVDFSGDERYMLWRSREQVTVYEAGTGRVVNDTIGMASLMDARFTPDGSALLLHSSGMGATSVLFVAIGWVVNPYNAFYRSAFFGDNPDSAGRGWFSPDGKLYLYQREDGTLRMLANPFTRLVRPRPRQ